MIYGANGYTGRLVAVEARRRDLKPVLAGRRAGPIERLAAELGLPVRVFGLDDATTAAAAIADTAIVANCAGPFAATSSPIIDACLTSRAHYLDITGEIDVFLAAQRRHADAQAAGIVICPGVGFDVIPTDCMASVLKEAQPDATHLILAFDARGPMSPGTARTMVRSLRLGKHGSRVRRNGVRAAGNCRGARHCGIGAAAYRLRGRLRYGDRYPLGRSRSLREDVDQPHRG